MTSSSVFIKIVQRYVMCVISRLISSIKKNVSYKRRYVTLDYVGDSEIRVSILVMTMQTLQFVQIIGRIDFELVFKRDVSNPVAFRQCVAF